MPKLLQLFVIQFLLDIISYLLSMLIRLVAIPYRMYSLLESDIDVDQFLNTIYRYIQLGVHIKAYYSKEYGKFHREVDEVVEFYVDDNNKPQSHILYQKTFGKAPVQNMPTKHLKEYLENQNIFIDNLFTKGDSMNNIDSEVNKVISPSSEQTSVNVVESPNFNTNVNNVSERGQTIQSGQVNAPSQPKATFPTEIV